MTDSPKMMQANAKFRKLQRAEGAKKNLSEIEANDALVRANTAPILPSWRRGDSDPGPRPYDATSAPAPKATA